jgi:hypothetical protein
LLLLILALLVLLVLSALVVGALGGPGGIASLGHLTATVTITPQHQDVQNNFLITALTTTPNASKRQVAARELTASSGTQTATANATGSIPAKRATGSLVFFNNTGGGLTIAGGGQTVLTGADGVQITFNESVFVPATGSSTTINDAYAVNAGARGNIPALDITGFCCVPGNAISVKNIAAFHGGQDALQNNVIEKSDIDGATQPLVNKLTSNEQAALQQQVKSNEHVVDGSLQCPATTSANHNEGDIAKSVTVSASVTCHEEVFDLAAAEQIANTLLPTNLPSHVNLLGYQRIGPIITNLVSDSVVSAQGQVSVQISAIGRWVYQFSSQTQQQIKQALTRQSKANAQRILAQYTGVSTATIQLSSGSTMPTNVSDITLNVVSVPDLSQSPPAATPTPYVTVTALPATPPSNGSDGVPPGGGS